MSLIAVLEEREKKAELFRADAMHEVRRLASLLRKHYAFKDLYVCGSIVSGRFGLHSDVDMVISGLKTDDFFKAYALILRESSHNIDMKPFEDLTEDFKKKVLTKGAKIG